MFRSIAITGASGGIGAALAEACAAPGVTLFLAGRDVVRLDAVAGRCGAKGAKVHVDRFDVTDAEAARAWVERSDAVTPLDLLIANAGVTSGLALDGSPERFEDVRRVLAVNLHGVVNVVEPALARMLPRRRGRLVLIGSLAGLRGLPSCPSYSASKAAVHAYGQALRGWLNPLGIGVTVVCPGYVASAMSDRVVGAKPLLMSAERAAGLVLDAARRGKAMAAFPRILALGIGVLNFLPEPMAQFFLRAFRFSVDRAEGE